MFSSLGLFIVTSLFLAISSLAQASPSGTFKGWQGAPDAPTSAGYHNMVYEWQEAGQTRRMPLVLYLPTDYTPSRQYPALVFLSGMGERGDNPHVVMNCGIPVDLGQRPDVQKWLPMIMILPACPSDRTWDTPGMAAEVVQLVRAAIEHWPIERSRVYVTGLSMGGRGSWALAREAPDLFAVAAPLVSRELDPELTAAKLDGSGTRLLVISGMMDQASEPASKIMVDAMRTRDIDVTYVPVPRASHFLWPRYYGSRAFYEWLMLHRRGEPTPPNRASAEHLTGLYFVPEQGGEQFQQKMQEQFATFAQYWMLDNCGNRMDPGLKPEAMGQKNVFVSHPLTREVACRLQLTQVLPQRPGSYLHLVGGRHPEGKWDLIVRIDEVEVFKAQINPETCPSGWFSYDINLDRYAGREIRLQVIHQAPNWGRVAAYWRDVRVVLAPEPKP